MKKALFVLIVAAFAVAAYAGDPVEVWNETYDWGGHNSGQNVAVDASGNVYVVGLCSNGTDNDYLVVKYNADGDTLWSQAYDRGIGNDNDYGIALDASANIYVTGFSYNGVDNDILTVKFDSDGGYQWDEIYDSGSGDDQGYEVVVDASANIYVTGFADNGTDHDWRTIKYDSSGNELMVFTYDAGDRDHSNSVAVDGTGNVYVTGRCYNGSDDDLRTIKYDSEGTILWNKDFDSGYDDRGSGIAVDGQGDVYVAGFSNNGSNNDWRTIKYDPGGNEVWNKEFDADSTDYTGNIAVDDYFVYVTGSSHNGTDYDWRTIRYDKDGNVGWNIFLDSGDADNSYGIAVDEDGFLYVTGGFVGADWDMRTIKYQQDDYPVGVTEPSSQPSSVTLKVAGNFTSTPIIRYSLPVGQPGALSFYSADGSKIDSYTLDPTQSAFSWITDRPSGIYFIRLEAGFQTAQAKVVLTR